MVVDRINRTEIIIIMVRQLETNTDKIRIDECEMTGSKWVVHQHSVYLKGTRSLVIYINGHQFRVSGAQGHSREEHRTLNEGTCV